jgi:hypothetical protein
MLIDATPRGELAQEMRHEALSIKGLRIIFKLEHFKYQVIGGT